jgi:hypothetical protein
LIFHTLNLFSVLFEGSNTAATPLAANLVTPREHLKRLTSVRKQIVTETSSGRSGDSTPTNLSSPGPVVVDSLVTGVFHTIFKLMHVPGHK